MNRSCAFWSASAAIIFATIISGCGKKDEPMPLGHAPAAEVSAETGGVASAPPSEANPASSAAGEGKTIGGQESGEFF